jgi:NADH dehydrogenase [ubiquinone] 1 alpha subcomplex assembly factor 1
MEAEGNVCDFSSTCLTWRNVDDVVMGGVSRSAMQLDGGGSATFSGILSLERNGGFASVRTSLDIRDFSLFSRFRIRVKGDGRRYSFRVRNDDRFDGVVYASDFETAAGQWEEIDLPFSSFRPLFRGLVVPGAAPMDPGNVAQIGFLIAAKQDGPFRLQVGWIRAA